MQEINEELPQTHIYTQRDIQPRLNALNLKIDGLFLCRLGGEQIPSFSFMVEGGRIKFVTSREMSQAFRSISTTTRKHSKYFESYSDLSDDDFVRVARVLDHLFEHSIYFVNYRANQTKISIAEINALAKDPKFNAENLAKFLSQKARLEITYAHIDSSGTLHCRNKKLTNRLSQATTRFRLREARMKGHTVIIDLGVERAVICSIKPAYIDLINTEFLICLKKGNVFEGELDLLVKCANAFFMTRYIHHRYQLIASVQDQSLKGLYAPGITTRSSINKLIRKHCKECARIIISNLPADSVTIRLFDCHNNSLNVVVEEVSSWGAARTEAGVRNIPLSRVFESVNAFVFSEERVWQNGVYLPKIGSIPPVYKTYGLKSVYSRRPNTVSEYCLPIIFGAEPIGTINIESRFEDAFSEEDRLSIRILKNSVETFIRGTYFENDIFWMAQQGFTSLTIHELEQTLSTESFFDERQKKYLQQNIVGKQRPKAKRGARSLFDIGKDIAARLEAQPYDPITRNRMSSVLTVSQNVGAGASKRIGGYEYQMISSMISNMLDNTGNYGDVDRDKIVLSRLQGAVDADQHHARGSSQRFKIRWKTIGVEDPEIWQRVTVSPIVGNDEEMHFGLFFVGLAARQMGGFAFVSGDSRSGWKTIEVRVRA